MLLAQKKVETGSSKCNNFVCSCLYHKSTSPNPADLSHGHKHTFQCCSLLSLWWVKCVGRNLLFSCSLRTISKLSCFSLTETNVMSYCYLSVVICPLILRIAHTSACKSGYIQHSCAFSSFWTHSSAISQAIVIVTRGKVLLSKLWTR